MWVRGVSHTVRIFSSIGSSGPRAASVAERAACRRRARTASLPALGFGRLETGSQCSAIVVTLIAGSVYSNEQVPPLQLGVGGVPVAATTPALPVKSW